MNDIILFIYFNIFSLQFQSATQTKKPLCKYKIRKIDRLKGKFHFIIILIIN